MNRKLLLAGSMRTMSRYKLRTLFMSLGVTVGVAVLVAGQSMGSSTEQQIGERVNQMFGPGTILLVSRAAGTLKIADLEAIGERFDQVLAWDPKLGIGGLEVSYGGASRPAAIDGVSERAEFVWNRSVTEGRFLTTADLDRSARVALIGPKLAVYLFGDRSPLDEEIMLGSVPFLVVGVLEGIGIDPHGEDRDEDVYVPITTAMRRLSNADSIGMAKFVVRDHEQVEDDAEAISAFLRERHRIGAGEPDDFGIYSSKFAGRTVKRANRVLRLYLLAGVVIVLLVAAIVISTIMLAAVRERIAEIGLRKAVGATEGEIGFQFLVEVVCISMASGLMGVVLGIAVIFGVSGWYQMPAVVTIDSVVLGLVVAVLVGVVSGILPARRASRMDPIEALR